MDMLHGNQVAYLGGGLAATCGTLGLTQSTFGLGLTARRSDLGAAGLGTADLGIAFGPALILLRREHLSLNNQSLSIQTNNTLYLVV